MEEFIFKWIATIALVVAIIFGITLGYIIFPST